jgi:hypothetical protein
MEVRRRPGKRSRRTARVYIVHDMWVARAWMPVAVLAWVILSPEAARAQGVDGPGGLGGLPPERMIRVKVPPPVPSFQMGFEVMHVLDEDGDLSHPGQSASSAGLRFVFREARAIRQHITFAHHWEQQGGVSRRGFRLDLLALGFPIQVMGESVRLAVEPILRVLRAEVLFESENTGASRALFRLQSGFALAINGEWRSWFASIEPLSIDLRYLAARQADSRTGLSRIWSLATVLGREF